MTKIGERVQKLVATVATDEDCIELILDMEAACSEYVKTVVDMEFNRHYLKEIMDADEYRKEVESLDRARTIVHNDMMAKVNAVNRLCNNINAEAIYEGDEERSHYGDFAQDLVNEIFNERIK